MVIIQLRLWALEYSLHPILRRWRAYLEKADTYRRSNACFNARNGPGTGSPLGADTSRSPRWTPGPAIATSYWPPANPTATPRHWRPTDPATAPGQTAASQAGSSTKAVTAAAARHSASPRRGSAAAFQTYPRTTVPLPARIPLSSLDGRSSVAATVLVVGLFLRPIVGAWRGSAAAGQALGEIWPRSVARRYSDGQDIGCHLRGILLTSDRRP